MIAICFTPMFPLIRSSSARDVTDDIADDVADVVADDIADDVADDFVDAFSTASEEIIQYRNNDNHGRIGIGRYSVVKYWLPGVSMVDLQ